MCTRPPSVRIAKPTNRPYQLRYTCPIEQREIRISVGSRDDDEAEEQKKELEAKLLVGVEAKPRRRKAGPHMLWEDFRERYSELQLSTLRERSAIHAESRLDIAERILKPRRLSDVANSEALHDLQKQLLTGVESRTGKPRSPITVRGYMTAVLTALNWAEYMEWLPSVPKVRKIKTARLRHMKGRPITLEEFERMLDATDEVVGERAAESWKFVLRGLWESGLRLGELMHVHWTDTRCIVPDWNAGAHPVLTIPAPMQKNATEESIPMLPGLDELFSKTQPANRIGWVFNPASLQTKVGRKPRTDRIGVEWVGKVITDIGEKAGVVVLPPDGTRPAKFASAHDLRRSCADRLIAAGVPEREVAAVMRHASVETTRRHYAPGTVQRSAATIKAAMDSTTVVDLTKV